MEILSLEGIKKKYDKKDVLNIDSLLIKKGDIHGYLGRNGSGKTTTIKIIMGIISQDQGKVIFQNEETNYKKPSFKRKIGYCPDYPAVFESLTVLEHLHFMAYLYGITDMETINSKINDMLKHYDIEKYKTTPIKHLSKGNKQKVSIVASIIHDPLLLVYDEPTLGLDPLSIKQFKSMLKNFTYGGGTVFLSSHSINVIEEVADTVSIINNGSIIKKNISINKVRSTLVSLEEYLVSALEGEE